MRDTLIQYKRKSQGRSNIYKIDNLNGSFNPVQNGKYIFHQMDGKYRLEISHENIEGFSNILLDVNLPEIKGFGKVGYNYNFGFSLIKSFKIIINKVDIYNTNGQELLRFFKQKSPEYVKELYDNSMLNNDNWLDYRIGNGSDYVIYPAKVITIPLCLFFDENIPFGIFRVPKGSTITFELELLPITSVINYDITFKNKSLHNIYNVYSPYINLSIYNTINESITNRYIDQYQEIKHPVDNIGRNSFSTAKFKGITNLIYYIKSPLFQSDKAFITYPTISMSEKDMIRQYEKRLLSDIIVITNDIETIKSKYPEDSKFVKVENNTVRFNKFNTCIVEILGVPDGYDVYYHTNILTFSRRENEKQYNISEKFSRISGIFYPVQRYIDFTFIKSNLEINDISIPVEFWNDEVNTSYGDLRSESNKLHDIYINNPTIEGLDFLGKNNGIMTSTLSDNNNILVDTNNKGFLPKLSIISDKNKYITRYGTTFNNNDINFVEPSRLLAKPNENFDRCQLNLEFTKYGENDIRNLFKYDLYIGITHSKKITYDKDTINVVD